MSLDVYFKIDEDCVKKVGGLVGEKNGGRVIAEPPRRTLGVSRGLGQSPSGGKGQSPSETQSLTYFREDELN